jgi:hypothetical protein
MALARRIEQAGIPAGAPEPALDGQCRPTTFPWRIAGNNLTGTSGQEENEQGLEDARFALTG